MTPACSFEQRQPIQPKHVCILISTLPMRSPGWIICSPWRADRFMRRLTFADWTADTLGVIYLERMKKFMMGKIDNQIFSVHTHTHTHIAVLGVGCMHWICLSLPQLQIQTLMREFESCLRTSSWFVHSSEPFSLLLTDWPIRTL